MTLKYLGMLVKMFRHHKILRQLGIPKHVKHQIPPVNFFCGLSASLVAEQPFLS